MKQKIIAQGAEAKIILNKNYLIKARIAKPYRLPILDDKIRRQRTRKERALIERASKVTNTPEIIKVIDKDNDSYDSNTSICMTFIDGKKLSEELDNLSLEHQKRVCKIIGEEVSKLHDSDIIHGDLTTSNMILKDNKVFFVDFGLGFDAHHAESKAVDLHLLKQALEAKHFKHWETLWKEIEKGYMKSKNSKQVLERLKAVERRGRYKDKY